jgi:hypothetical protein
VSCDHTDLFIQNRRPREWLCAIQPSKPPSELRIARFRKYRLRAGCREPAQRLELNG